MNNKKNKNNHYCYTCRVSIKSPDHSHCQKCGFNSDGSFKTLSDCSRWSGDDVYQFRYQKCGYINVI